MFEFAPAGKAAHLLRRKSITNDVIFATFIPSLSFESLYAIVDYALRKWTRNRVDISSRGLNQRSDPTTRRRQITQKLGQQVLYGTVKTNRHLTTEHF